MLWKAIMKFHLISYGVLIFCLFACLSFSSKGKSILTLKKMFSLIQVFGIQFYEPEWTTIYRGKILKLEVQKKS